MRNGGQQQQQPAGPVPVDTSRLVHIKNRHLLRSVRQTNGLSQYALASRAQVHRTTVTHWESGRVTNMHYGCARLVARALGVHMSVLFEPMEQTNASNRPRVSRVAAPAARTHPAAAC